MLFCRKSAAGVWIEFEGGDVSYPIWVGCYWHDGEQPSDATTSVLAIVTKASQKILLDTRRHHHRQRPEQQYRHARFQRHHAEGQRPDVALGSSGVNVNNGALEVT